MDESRSDAATGPTAGADAAADRAVVLEAEAEARAGRRREGLATLAITGLALAYAVYFFVDTLEHSWRIKALPVGFVVCVVLLAAFELYKVWGQLRRAGMPVLGTADAPRAAVPEPRRPADYVVAGAEILFVLFASWLLIRSIGTLPLGLTMAAYGAVLFAAIERAEMDAKGLVLTAVIMGLVGYGITRFFPGVG